MATKKVTAKEYRDYIKPRLRSGGFSNAEEEAIASIFSSDLNDLEPGERNTIFQTAVPGLTVDEFKKKIAELRDPHSLLSKSLRIRFYDQPEKLDLLEKLLTEAYEENKEPWL